MKKITVENLISSIQKKFDKFDIFFGHGTYNSLDESVWLISSILKIPSNKIHLHLKNIVEDSNLQTIQTIAKERIAYRKPLAYLLKEGWLRELNFFVDERVLVPRSLIADLIDNQFYPWIENLNNIENVLDLCTGSGCLGILLAYRFKNLKVDITDISHDAIDVANINIKKHNLENRVTAIQSDLFLNLKNNFYDLIVSNPPYVNAYSMKDLPQEYQLEPQNALASGKDGLDHTRKIIAEAKKYLKDDGKLFIEIGHNRDEVEKAFKHINIWWVDTESGSDYIFMIEKKDLP